MAITGTDEISLKILNTLKSGTKVKDIPTMFPVSLDNAKRLSRYSRILEKAEENLHLQIFEKVRLLGLKVLHLAPLFKQEDWEGLTEILSTITEKTKREELPLLITALKEKRERIGEFQKDVNSKREYLQKREK
ncbi:hypothetical protein [Metabacillus rhizolycopersici]|uniref:Uncharacterized protein n=1 Tax=Metabacillus rhizolycopersici TaxID=2875709 RepID=A0ABS7UWY3_9BACI|nr:hypothetical protein [Metabacillus rhizolycopersici]MBZ5752749.1 hypothetical protein [Metabacillus rhizolycopersici]